MKACSILSLIGLVLFFGLFSTAGGGQQCNPIPVEQICSTDSECNVGEVCSPERRCIEPQCLSDEDCGQGGGCGCTVDGLQWCEGTTGQCVDNICQTRREYTECGVNQYCSDGTCRNTCGIDSDDCPCETVLDCRQVDGMVARCVHPTTKGGGPEYTGPTCSWVPACQQDLECVDVWGENPCSRMFCDSDGGCSYDISVMDGTACDSGWCQGGVCSEQYFCSTDADCPAENLGCDTFLGECTTRAPMCQNPWNGVYLHTGTPCFYGDFDWSEWGHCNGYGGCVVDCVTGDDCRDNDSCTEDYCSTTSDNSVGSCAHRPRMYCGVGARLTVFLDAMNGFLVRGIDVPVMRFTLFADGGRDVEVPRINFHATVTPESEIGPCKLFALPSFYQLEESAVDTEVCTFVLDQPVVVAAGSSLQFEVRCDLTDNYAQNAALTVGFRMPMTDIIAQDAETGELISVGPFTGELTQTHHF